MPIIDRDYEGDGVRVVRVSKEGLDPFGHKQQVLREVNRSVAVPFGPATQDVEFAVTDKGEYYEVAMRAKRNRAGPSGVARPQGMVGGFNGEWGPKGNRGRPEKDFEIGQGKKSGGKPDTPPGLLSVDTPTQRADDDTGAPRDKSRKQRAEERAKSRGKPQNEGRGREFGFKMSQNAMRVEGINGESPAWAEDASGGRVLGGSFDLQSQLDTLYSAPELRSAARRAGVYTGNTMDKRRLIEQIERQDPALARRLAGR